ncbi:MAG: hypothetical protein M1828_007587 [Chrysothrix sp. TS-e1954]|nr:MAG: hypothetical protein M1828_007587 [Chrysothrix sp. TS-e1954]
MESNTMQVADGFDSNVGLDPSTTENQISKLIIRPTKYDLKVEVVGVPGDSTSPGRTYVVSQPESLVEEKHNVSSTESVLYSSSAGFMDKVEPLPTPLNHYVEGAPASPATRLKHRLEGTKDLIVCPGVYDGLSARIALSVGCDAMYMTGAGTTASALGKADLGLATLNDMVRQADMIANLDCDGPPLIADMDTGYGGPITIASAVQLYVRANVAGFHIEDQVLTKRCGHLSGKKVVTQDVFLSRIRAAQAAKKKARSDIVLIARTDANQTLGYDECISRLRAARDHGADCGLLEGFASKAQARQAVIDLKPWPLLLNIVENGHSPLITVDEAREMGFRIMIFSFAAVFPAYLAIKGAYEKLRDEGVTGNQGSGVNPIKLFEVCGLRHAIEIDTAAGGEDFMSGI